MREITWRKSSLSGPWTDNCVEFAMDDNGNVLLRDSKNPGQGYFTFSQDEWTAFTGGVKLGEFDLA